MSGKQTPSQTIGPFFSYCLTPETYGHAGVTTQRLATPDTRGEHIRIEGHVYDGAGAPVTDALIEIWQANAAGRYAHPTDTREDIKLDPGFNGFGRTGTDQDGYFWFETVKPGRVPGRGNTLQAPHIGVIVFARGMLNHAFTRLYFADEAAANAQDAVLGAVPAARRGTLVARPVEGRAEGGVAAGAAPCYRLDIRLQGEEETVFFDA